MKELISWRDVGSVHRRSRRTKRSGLDCIIALLKSGGVKGMLIMRYESFSTD